MFTETKNNMNRNQAIKKMAATALGVVALPQMAKSMAALPEAV